MFRRLIPCVALFGLVALIEGMIKAKAGGPKGLEGIDAKRPMALYGMFGEGGIETGTVIGLVPIADEKAFLGLIENLGAKAEKDKDGVYSVTGDNVPAPIYFRFAHKHAYVTALNKDALDKDKLLPPGTVLPAGKAPVFSVTVRIDQIPDKVRELAVGQVEAQLDAAKEEKKEDETPAQKAVKVAVLDLMKKHVVSVIKDGGEVALRLDVDQKAQDLSFELALSGKDGTPLAKTISALGKHKSIVAGLISPQSVMNMVINLPIDEKIVATIRTLIQEQVDKETDATKKAEAQKIIKAFGPALKFTEADLAFDLRGPTKGGLYTLVGGMQVADGRALDKAMRDSIKDLPENERAQIKFDADKAGDVAIHQINTAAGGDDFKKSFGDGPAYFAARSDAAFVAMGEGALDALKAALKSEPKVAAPVVFEVSVARLAQAMAAEKPDAPKAAAKAFAKDQAADKIRFSLEAGTELKLRFAMKTPVLTFFHLMEPGADVK
jgi:hypothetical protein